MSNRAAVFVTGALVCRTHQDEENAWRTANSPSALSTSGSNAASVSAATVATVAEASCDGSLDESASSTNVSDLSLSQSAIDGFSQDFMQETAADSFGMQTMDMSFGDDGAVESFVTDSFSNGDVVLSMLSNWKNSDDHIWSGIKSPDQLREWLGEYNIEGLQILQFLEENNAPKEVVAKHFRSLSQMAAVQKGRMKDPILNKTVDEELNLLVLYEAKRVKENAMFGSVDEIAAFFEYSRKHCPTIWRFLSDATNQVAKEKRNKSRDGLWSDIWSGFVLVQLLKVRSQRANLFGFYFFGYFYYYGLQQAANSLLVPTLTCDTAHFHATAKAFIKSDAYRALAIGILDDLQGRMMGKVVFIQDNLEKHLKSADKGEQSLLHLITTIVCVRDFSPLPFDRQRLVLCEDLTWREVKWSYHAFELRKGEPERVIALLADTLHDALFRGGAVKEKPVKLERRLSTVSKTRWNPLPAQKLNGASTSDHQRNLQSLVRILKPQDGERVIIFGDGLYVRNVELAKAGFATPTVTHLGLFHYMWNVPMQITWLWFSRLREVAAEIRGVCFAKVTKVWTAHNDLLGAVLSVYAQSGWSAWCKTLDIPHLPIAERMRRFATWIYHGILDDSNMTEGYDMRRFLVMVAMFWTMRRAVRANAGDDIFLIMRWYLPFQAGLLASSQYLPLCIRWCKQVMAMEPAERDLTIFNLTVNSEGRKNHFIAMDMFLEHYNLALKKVMRSRSSALTAEHIEYLSHLIVLLTHIREEVDKYFSRPRVSQKHTVLAFKDELCKLGKRQTLNADIFVSEEIHKKNAKKRKDLTVLHPVAKEFENLSVGVKFAKRVSQLLANLEHNDPDDEVEIEENDRLNDEQIDAIENDERRD